jgi:hypothetical protein
MTFPDAFAAVQRKQMSATADEEFSVFVLPMFWSHQSPLGALILFLGRY